MEITDEQVTEALEEMRKLRRTEALVDRAAQEGDKLETALTVTHDGTVLDEQKSIDAIIGENKYIKGFEEALVGLKVGDEKSFELKFPKDYYNKELVGKTATFAVKIAGVYELTLPELNDAFAAATGSVKTLDELKVQLRENLKAEADYAAEQAFDNELIKLLIEKSEFGEIPELLINSEVKKMMQEMSQKLAQQKTTMDDYLKRINKKESEFMLELTPQAVERAKSALVIRQVVVNHDLEVSEKEISEKITALKQMYQHAPEMSAQFDKPEYKEHLHNSLLARKALEFLRSHITEK